MRSLQVNPDDAIGFDPQEDDDEDYFNLDYETPYVVPGHEEEELGFGDDPPYPPSTSPSPLQRLLPLLLPFQHLYLQLPLHCLHLPLQRLPLQCLPLQCLPPLPSPLE